MTGETAFEGVERSGEGGLLELFDNRCTDNFVHFLLSPSCWTNFDIFPLSIFRREEEMRSKVRDDRRGHAYFDALNVHAFMQWNVV